jgi:hypothetical protein
MTIHPELKRKRQDSEEDDDDTGYLSDESSFYGMFRITLRGEGG